MRRSGKSKKTISEHIRYTFSEGELDERVVVWNFRTTTRRGAMPDRRRVSSKSGHLPNNLTVERLQARNANIRNPIRGSYVAKGPLPPGAGSDTKRVLGKWLVIDPADDHDGCLFNTAVHRKPVEEPALADEGALTGHVVD